MADGQSGNQKQLMSAPERFLNRELSWLEFNQRVLEEASNQDHPLLERLRFLSISASNLDEFEMVRYAGLREQVRAGVVKASQDGLTPGEQVDRIEEASLKLIAEQQARWRSLKQELHAEGVDVLGVKDLNKKDRTELDKYFRSNIFPVLTPLAVDPAHPFPFIPNLGFSIAINLVAKGNGEDHVGIIPLPAFVRRFIRLPKGTKGNLRFIALEDVIGMFIDELFPGFEEKDRCLFRVIRDSDIEIEEEAEDLIREFEVLLKQRRRGRIVRIRMQSSAPEDLRRLITHEIGAEEADIVLYDGILGMAQLSELIVSDRPDLQFPSYEPRYPERIREMGGDCFAAIRAKDILVHHPFETFDVVVQFIRQAAADPQVVAIKQTLYRTTANSPIVAALIEAAEAGKNVTALVEIKARFDEEANL
ncbi:polyphosphate kinase 1, partial [Hyphomonas sp. UBA3195]|uniref:polyphosphate kinase 1 n=1 Tax=Hyphomonas sp. UBA3195 TaxID=1946622 RepID=UPI0025C6D098